MAVPLNNSQQFISVSSVSNANIVGGLCVFGGHFPKSVVRDELF